MSNEEIKAKIARLKKEKNAVILAHYYVDGEVQAIADFVGDSYYLAEKATTVSEDAILFCGVSFMGESAKILNPEKKVVMAESSADCPMAHMVDVEKIKEVREQYPDVAVVCYVNSTAEIKAHSDVCVTSSNALKIVKKLPNEHIFFIPDENLGRHIAEKLPDKHFIFNDGFCHVHKSIHKEDILKAKEVHPEALVLAHPECPQTVLKQADYIGSTSGIIKYAQESDNKEFIICTECGVQYKLETTCPDKKFYFTETVPVCKNMKKVLLEKVLHVLKTGENEVHVTDETREKAKKPLERMLELAK